MTNDLDYTALVNTEDIAPAYLAYHNGDPEPLGRLYADFLPLMEAIATKSTLDHDEAMSSMSEAFLTLPAAADLTRRDALGYIIGHLRLSIGFNRRDRKVPVPHALVSDYRRLKATHRDEANDQGQEWVTRAYDFLKLHKDATNRMSATTFLSVHAALQADEHGTLSTHPIGLTDDEGNDVGIIDIPEDDVYADVDTRDLVRQHLLPLLDDDERLVVLVTYGFSDLVPDALDKVLVEKGVDLTDGRNLPLSSRTAAEVLGTNGYGLDKMGYMTVQRRLKSALAKMRTYLEEDSRRENA